MKNSDILMSYNYCIKYYLVKIESGIIFKEIHEKIYILKETHHKISTSKANMVNLLTSTSRQVESN